MEIKSGVLYNAPMNKKEGAFYLLTGPSDESVMRQIATQYDLPVGMVRGEEVKRAFQLVQGVPAGREDDSLGRIVREKYFHHSRTRPAEDDQQLGQRAEVLFDTFPASFSSYGLEMLDYRDALRAQKAQEGEASVGHRAVLLGGFSVDTIHEFAVTVRDVYPTAECQVVDVEGYKTVQVSPDKALFVKESALRLSTEDGQIDSLHINNLLHMLVDPEYAIQDDAENQLQLFEEAHRVLRPGGLLLMVEERMDADTVFENLQAVGFRMVTMNPARSFKSRRDMEQFLRSTADEPLPGIKFSNMYGTFIVAKKD